MTYKRGQVSISVYQLDGFGKHPALWIGTENPNQIVKVASFGNEDKANLEKVIKGLECRLDINHEKYKHCLSCQYRVDADHLEWTCMTDGILEDALSLLKEQEPRVMTLEEAKLLPVDSDVWIETYGSTSFHSRLYAVSVAVNNSDELVIRGCLHYFTWKHYGNDFRVWTSRPTDEQRKAVPWEPPKEETK